MKYVYLLTSGGIRKLEEADTVPPNSKPTEGRWLKLVRAAKPVFDPETELLNSSTIITDTEYQITYSVLPKPEELLQAAAREAERLAVKEDVFVKAFIAMTPAELTDYVTANVTDLASARQLLLQLSKMLLLLAKKTYGAN